VGAWLLGTSVLGVGCGDATFKAGPGDAGAGGSSVDTPSVSGAGAGGRADGGGSSAGANAAGASGCDPNGAGDCACDLGHLVISVVRSRGPNGGADEFIELYNPTEAEVTLDSSWAIEGKNATSSASTAYNARWSGGGNVIAAHGHFLLVGTAYAQSPPGDEALSIGITDGASLRLMQNGSTIDAVCYYFDPTTQTALATSAFTCEGDPVSNLPHDDTSSSVSNGDVSIERAPGGDRGNCTDTGNNAADFSSSAPASPQNAASPLTP
jgi:large repetitive protein